MFTLIDSDKFNILYDKGGIFNQTGLPASAQAASHFILERNTKSEVFSISVQHRAQGANHFLPVKRLELRVVDHIASIERLLELLRGLPTQFPRADGEDLYGRNANLKRVMSTMEYMDFCRDQWDIPPPIEEQKVMFDEAAAIIEKWAE